MTPTVATLARFALVGALLAQPFALLVWLGAEHGGRGLATFPYAAMWGAGLGVVLALAYLLVRYLYKRNSGARTA